MAGEKEKKSWFDKLNGRNFSTWSYRMQLYLKNEGCWDVINLPNRPDGISERSWNKKESHANYLISIMVENNQLPIIKRCDSARSTWIDLCKHHRKSTFSAKIRLLRKLYHEMLPKNGNMENHLSKIMEHYDELCEIGHIIEEQQFVSIVLTSVGEEYDHLVTALDCRKEDELTLDLVKCKLLDEYDRKMNKENKEESESVMKVQGMKYCDFCKGAGHLKKSCFKFEEWLNRKKNEQKKESLKAIKSGQSNYDDDGELHAW